MTAFLDAVRAGLASSGDPERAAQQQAYMKSALPYHGLRSAELKALLRPLLVENRFEDRSAWEATARELWDKATHREERYAALALLRHSGYGTWIDVDLVPLLEHLVRTGAWWDYVDEIASHLVGQVLLEDRSALTPLMSDWAVDEHLWVRRTAMLCQLRHRRRTDTDLLEHALVTNLDDTVLGKDRLSGLSRREALKHLA